MEADRDLYGPHNKGITHDGSSSRNSVVSDEAVLDAARPVEDAKDNGTVDLKLFGMSVSVPARWLLFSVPFMWGSFGPAVRLLFSQHPHLEPSVFNTARLFMSTAVYVPILLTEFTMYMNSRSSSQTGDSEMDADEDRYSFVKAGIELGIYVFLANVAQVLGLQQVSAARAAFLVQLQTVIVPVLSGLLGLEVVGRNTLISSGIAVAGVALLSLDKGHGTTSSLSGDALELVSAFFFSAYIIRLGRYCNNTRSSPLVATKILVQAVLSSAWAFGIAAMSTSHSNIATVVSDSPIPEWTFPVVALNFGVIAWTGLISSAASGWMQTKGQQKVPASDAVVIFATQPLWASAIAAVLLGEGFGPRALSAADLSSRPQFWRASSLLGIARKPLPLTQWRKRIRIDPSDS